MHKITLKAFVHPIESNLSGFIYAHLKLPNITNFIRISSADESGNVQVISFQDSIEMLREANAQCHCSESLVLADETVLSAIEGSSLDMLMTVLREQHPYLFEAKARLAC